MSTAPIPTIPIKTLPVSAADPGTQVIDPGTSPRRKNGGTGFITAFLRGTDAPSPVSFRFQSEESTIPLLNTKGVPVALPSLTDFFVLQEQIGNGGFSDIYRAFDKRLMRTVAVKTLHADKIERYSCRSAFLTEAKVTAFLDHPFIIPIHGIYTDSKRQLHLVMKLINGITLKTHLKQTVDFLRTLPLLEVRLRERHLLAERLELFLKVCDAMSYAHFKQVLHRDLKPENIMIGHFNEVYVMDWGIAEHRSVNTLSSFSGELVGSLQYIAPEFLAKQPYDSRSDVYSLGVILFETVFLKAAFPPEGLSQEQLSTKIMNGETGSFRHLFGAHIPRNLRKIVKKALNPVPAARYQTVRLMADDIRNFLRGEPLSNSSRFTRFIHCLCRKRIF